MGAFAANALNYAARGLAVFPVDTREKKPLVRGWQKAGVGATRQWAEKFPDADGLGVVCGPRSGITEVDVDILGDAALAAAIERFGYTPVVIRTASGKWKLWYRHSGEGRRNRPVDGLPIDLLGAGYTIAPPSYRGAGRSFKRIGWRRSMGLRHERAGPNPRRPCPASSAATARRQDGNSNRGWH